MSISTRDAIFNEIKCKKLYISDVNSHMRSFSEIIDNALNNNDKKFNTNLILFNKDNYATDEEENYDKITDNVWIWRGNSGPIKNRAKGTNTYNSPYWNWAEGKTEEGIENLSFFPSHYDVIQHLKDTEGFVGAQGMISQGRNNYVLKVNENDKETYYDIEFLSWTNGSNGGGFSYNRKLYVPQEILPDYQVSNITKSYENNHFTITFTLLNEPIIDPIVNLYNGNNFIGEAKFYSNITNEDNYIYSYIFETTNPDIIQSFLGVKIHIADKTTYTILF